MKGSERRSLWKKSYTVASSERGRANLRNILQRAVGLKHAWMYCVFACVSERAWCQRKSQVGDKSAGPCLPWEYLAVFMQCFMSAEAISLPFPNILLALVWRLNWSRRRTELDGDWPSGMLIIFLTRGSISYKICCYYRSAVVIIGRFSIFLAIWFFFFFFDLISEE